MSPHSYVGVSQLLLCQCCRRLQFLLGLLEGPWLACSGSSCLFIDLMEIQEAAAMCAADFCCISMEGSDTPCLGGH